MVSGRYLRIQPRVVNGNGYRDFRILDIVTFRSLPLMQHPVMQQMAPACPQTPRCLAIASIRSPPSGRAQTWNFRSGPYALFLPARAAERRSTAEGNSSRVCGWSQNTPSMRLVTTVTSCRYLARAARKSIVLSSAPPCSAADHGPMLAELPDDNETRTLT